MIKRIKSKAWRTRAALFMVTLLGAGACSEVTFDEFSEQFLIRRPSDSLLGAAPSFLAGPTATDALVFEWQPAPGADRYTLVFRQTESVDSMNQLLGDLQSPTITFAVDAPQIIEVPLSPSDTTGDYQRVKVVAHSLASPDLDAVLATAGVAKGGSMNTVWSVIAHKGNKSVRSVEVQRLVLRRRP